MKVFCLILALNLCYFQSRAQIIYGVNNYTQYHVGSLPLIISVPHGGLVNPANIPDRTCNNPTTVTDAYTIELARQIDTALFNLTGCRPHLILCNLKRTKIDCNRNIADGACGNAEAETAWNEFHHFIDTAQLISQNTFAGKAFYIDLHGHSKPILRLELGYGLSGAELNNTDTFLNMPAQIASSSIQNLVSSNTNAYTHAELLRGNFALGTLLSNAGFPSVPSLQTPDPDTTAYYTGGYNTINHTCISAGNTVNGLQLECHQTVRINYANRKAFADSFASIVANYLYIHQNLPLLTNCGLITNNLEYYYADENPITTFPNPFSSQTTLLTTEQLTNATLTVENCFGQVVKEIKNIYGHTATFSRDNLPNGLYFLQLQHNNKIIATDKIIITH